MGRGRSFFPSSTDIPLLLFLKGVGGGLNGYDKSFSFFFIIFLTKKKKNQMDGCNGRSF